MGVAHWLESSGEIARMRAAFERAEFAQACSIFDTNALVKRNAEATIMRARILLKADDSPAAIQLLLKLGAQESPLEFFRQLFLGVAYARSGEYAIADRHFVQAKSQQTNEAAEIAYTYWRGHRYILERKPDDAITQLRLLQKLNPKRAGLLALHLESFIAGIERRYHEQTRVLVALLRQIPPGSTEHIEIEAHATHTLAVLAREINEPATIAIVRSHVDSAVWPADFSVQRFQSLKALGWALALRGDNFNAFRLLRQSSATAPNDAWRVVALADRAYLAKCISTEWSLQELDEAESISEFVNWRATMGGERIGLILLAELFASADPSRAAFYLAKYRELGELRSPLLHYGDDERLDAIANYCAGIVHLALGERAEAINLLQGSYRVYDSIAYDWRAGRCALRLYEATGASQWLTIAKRKIAAYPHSWLANELRSLNAAMPAACLPPVQSSVFKSLCEGMSTKEIAETGGRSINTVRNHIKSIYRVFGVNSKPALLAEAARRGLL